MTCTVDELIVDLWGSKSAFMLAQARCFQKMKARGRIRRPIYPERPAPISWARQRVLR